MGITYVYNTEYYYDSEKKQSRYRRTLLGKLDPETGEIVPCGRPGRPRTKKDDDKSDTDYKGLYEDALGRISADERRIANLTERISSLEQTHRADLKQIEAYKKKLNEISKICDSDMT